MKAFAFFTTLLLLAAPSTRAADIRVLRVPDGGIQPQAAIDAKGNLDLIYYKGDAAAGDLFFVQREAGDEEFSRSIRVSRDDSTAVAAGTIRGAHLALGRNGRPHIAWMGSAETAVEVPGHPYKEHPMFYTRLGENGSEFEKPRNVITRTGGLDGGGSVAADSSGNVYVAWHGRTEDAAEGETGRAMYVARSTNEGKTFSAEEQANPEPTGACGCCGMGAFVDAGGRLRLLYRAANKVSRDMMLLTSSDLGKSFTSQPVSQWFTQSCPMSSSTMNDDGNGLLIATETTGQVEWNRLDATTGRLGKGVRIAAATAKHPSVAANRKGKALVTWAEGAGWAKGGTLHWQLFDSQGKPVGERGGGGELPTWSFATVVCLDGSNFTVIY